MCIRKSSKPSFLLDKSHLCVKRNLLYSVLVSAHFPRVISRDNLFQNISRCARVFDKIHQNVIPVVVVDRTRSSLQRFLFDYLYDDTRHIIINELITPSLNDAIDFVNNHFMELHAEGKSDISAIRLRTCEDETELVYEVHFDAVGTIDQREQPVALALNSKKNGKS